MAGADGRGLARPEPPRPRRREEWWGGQRSPRHSSSRAPGAPERSRGAPAEASPALPRLGACGRARRTGVLTVGGTEPLTARRCALPGPQRPHHGVDEPTCARQRGAVGLWGHAAPPAGAKTARGGCKSRRTASDGNTVGNPSSASDGHEPWASTEGNQAANEIRSAEYARNDGRAHGQGPRRQP